MKHKDSCLECHHPDVGIHYITCSHMAPCPFCHLVEDRHTDGCIMKMGSNSYGERVD